VGKRKLLIIDTSVLLYDKNSIHSFPGNDVVLPLIVLDELDRFKEKPGLLGESARYVNRYLDNLRSIGRLDKGVLLNDESDQTITVTCLPAKLDSDELDISTGDNMIIAAALNLKNKNKNKIIKVVTKDINLRVKCDALGLIAEDYYKDYVNVDEDSFKGTSTIYIPDDKIDDLYRDNSIPLEDHHLNIHPNTYITCKGNSQNKSALTIYSNDSINLIRNYCGQETDVKPRNTEQSFALHALHSTDVPLVSLTGLAGSGKTFLTLMAAIDQMHERKYERIVVTRNIQPVGKNIGYLPGDINEKMAPWMSPLLDNFRCHFKDKTYFELMMERGEIEIAPLSFIRGRTFNNSFLIVDEAQNATIHELKTIITRLGEGSKVVLMGDTDQIDTPYIDKNSNGLAIVVEKFKESNLAAHVHLKRGERSAIATYASKIL